MTALRGEWRQNFPMSKLSTWRVGGPAAELFLPADCEDMRAFVENDSRAKEALFIGHGSNILVRDGGIGGVVVRTAPGLTAMRFEDGFIYAEAGVGCPKVARFAVAAGGGDLAFLAGIPGTIGGALAMNAGCDDSEIWQFVEKVLVLKDNTLQQRAADDFIADYRSVRDKQQSPTNEDGQVFAGAWLRFSPENITAARNRMRKLLNHRRATQPLEVASCGSVFRNPPGKFAAKLIDSCGLKGETVGGARVSDKHANFIINNGQATAADIEQLVCHVQKVVCKKTGVQLVPEVKIIGKEQTHVH